MTREILFRGFHPCEDGDTTIYVEGEAVKGRWVGGGYWINDTVTRQTPHIIDFDGNSICVLPSTVCQYTGLTDKNGSKIFEGDILRNTIGDNGVIKYGIVPENLGWNGVPHIAFYAEWDCEDLRPDLPHWANRAEVTGTIWDKKNEHER